MVHFEIETSTNNQKVKERNSLVNYPINNVIPKNGVSTEKVWSTCVLKILRYNQIPLKRVIEICSDSTDVMFGRKHSVVTELTHAIHPHKMFFSQHTFMLTICCQRIFLSFDENGAWCLQPLYSQPNVKKRVYLISRFCKLCQFCDSIARKKQNKDRQFTTTVSSSSGPTMYWRPIYNQ